MAPAGVLGSGSAMVSVFSSENVCVQRPHISYRSATDKICPRPTAESCKGDDGMEDGR
jgi:hypothetical protein